MGVWVRVSRARVLAVGTRPRALAPLGRESLNSTQKKEKALCTLLRVGSNVSLRLLPRSERGMLIGLLPTSPPPLSRTPHTQCWSACSDLFDFFSSGFLDQLPEKLRRINSPSMFVKPDLDTPVFLRVIGTHSQNKKVFS